MKKLLIAVTAIAAMTASARASTLDFDFSFTNSIGSVTGTVTGEIIGVSNNTTGPATEVIIDSYPTGLTEPSPVPYIVPAADIVANSFMVSGGVIDAIDFNAHVVGAGDVITWELLLDNVPAQYLLANDGFGFSVDNTAVTFTPVAATPLPPTATLLATVLALLGCIGYWRKRKMGADPESDYQFA